MERSRIAMLIGLAALVLVVGKFISPIHFHGLFRGVSEVLPWLIFAFAIYMFFGKGGCCSSGRGSKDSSKAEG